MTTLQFDAFGRALQRLGHGPLAVVGPRLVPTGGRLLAGPPRVVDGDLQIIAFLKLHDHLANHGGRQKIGFALSPSRSYHQRCSITRRMAGNHGAT